MNKKIELAKKRNWKLKEYICEWCREKFVDTPTANRKFCSRRCKEKWQSSKPELSSRWKGGEKEYECLLCKSKFKRKPSNIKKVKNVFCSCKCRAIWYHKHQSRVNTNIERKMKEILIEKSFLFEEQVVFPKICIADFYLPKYKLAIFCDGEYWHDYPKGKKRDKEQIQELREIGINAIRLWSRQILTENPLQYLKQYMEANNV